MKRVCVFCGSMPGHDPAYAEAARALGELLAARDLGLVYGGARVGLMGAVADAALAAGGEVLGVIPRGLVRRELAHVALTDLEVVDTLGERKARMVERSDAFVALPGGFGTLDELFEVVTWSQLGLHGKPAGLLDVGGYWQGLVAWIETAVAAGFVPAQHAGMILRDNDAGRLLDALARQAPPPPKWSAEGFGR
jgi:uncharacterized protein (TIGR00730 family)